MRDAQAMISATKKALAAASIPGRTNEGRRTFQTIFTAAAFDGDGPSKVTANAGPSFSEFTLSTWWAPRSVLEG